MLMTQKFFKRFILLSLIFLLNLSFIGTITFAADQTSLTSSASSTISSSTQNKTSEDTKNTASKNDSLNKNSKDSSKDITNTNNKSNNKQDDKQADTQNEQSTDQKNEEFIDYGWKIIDNKKYYIVNNKILKTTGWFMEKDSNPNIKVKDKSYNNKYYLDKDFSVVTGWKQIDNSWYYFNSEGIMQTGWLSDNAWYYLDDTTGEMLTDWNDIDGYAYHFDEYGQAAIGKKLIDSEWYFFDNKARLKKGFYDYNGKTYYSDQDGLMARDEWITKHDHKFYIKSDGSIAVGKIFINGVMNIFDQNGYYIGSDATDNNYLYIKFLNVGNADCAFIKLPSGETVLIDTGDVSTTKTLINFLNTQKLKTEFFESKNDGQAVPNNEIESDNKIDTLQENAIIDNSSILDSSNTTNPTTAAAISINQNNGKGVIDYVVLTHPHSDHIGGVIELLKNFNIGKIIIPKNFQLKDYSEGVTVTKENESEVNLVKYDYQVYTETMRAIAKSGVPLTEAKPESYIDSENILQFLNTNKDYTNLGLKNFSGPYWAINDNSAIVYLNYRDLQALFTGDMQWNSEKDFVERKALSNKPVDILKVPHHGNIGSSSYSFVGYVNPTIGVISRAKESVNTTNQPYNTLTTCGVNIYETSNTSNGVSVYATKDNWNVENN